MKALCFEEFGNAKVLKYEEIPDPVVGPKNILVRTKAIGLNFADIYRRKGMYHLEGNPPYILGYEGAGVVEAIGDKISEYDVGDRVAFADVPHANAEYVCVPEEKAIPLPDLISYETAASILLQGLTADYLIHDSFRIHPDQTVVIHAISGGVGQLLLQMVKNKGAKVLGVTSSIRKQEIALSLGADDVFLHSDDWKSSILEHTKDGKGADVVYDSVGSTLLGSFDIVKTGGTVVFYGTAGGEPALIDPRMLMNTSKTLTGGDLWNILTAQKERIIRSHRLFDMILTNQLHLSPPTIYHLSEGAEAHQFLESRKSTGKVILVL